jgi:hypothetical protein
VATIDKRNGKYRVRIRRKGECPLVATFPSHRQAKVWAAATETAVLERKHLPSAEAQRYTVAVLIDRYLTNVLPHKSQSSIELQSQQRGWWKAQLGGYTLAAITPAMIAERCDLLARTRKASTVRRYLAALSHVFSRHSAYPC